MRPVLGEYLPIVLLGGLAIVFAITSLVASSFLRPNRPTAVKLSPYECGIDPVRLPRGERFSVKFYVVAMLFIIFDIEVIFLFPWAVTFRRLGLFGLIEMGVFIGLVFVAYAYVWRKGGLDWSGSSLAGDASAAVEPEPVPDPALEEAVGAR
jgi:NADH-quinone oxidoreductase subunit A